MIMKTLNSLNFDAGFQCIGTNYFYAVVDDGKSRDDGDYYFGGGGGGGGLCQKG
jgi:hypothetical protein